MSRGLRMTAAADDSGDCRDAKTHLDASQLLRKARKVDPGIDRVTVYRTLGLLKRHGLVDELDLMHLQGRSTSTSASGAGSPPHGLFALRQDSEFESNLFDG